MLVELFWISATAAAVLAALPVPFLSEWAKHGKLSSISSKKDMWMVPKKWFAHFYVFGIVAAILLVREWDTPAYLFLLHLVRRAIEQMWLFPYSNESKMHVTAYLFGFIYYTMVPLSLGDTPMSATLFVAANALQFACHRALYMNRQTSGSKRQLPPSPLFQTMVCPHYFAEMLIYISLSSVTSLRSILLAIFVVISLSVNWRNHSLWYNQQTLNQ